MVNTTITLNEQQSRWVQAQIEAALIKAESSMTKADFSQLSVDDVWAKAKLAFEKKLRKPNLENKHLALTSRYKNYQKFRPVNHQPKTPL